VIDGGTSSLLPKAWAIQPVQFNCQCQFSSSPRDAASDALILSEKKRKKKEKKKKRVWEGAVPHQKKEERVLQR